MCVLVYEVRVSVQPRSLQQIDLFRCGGTKGTSERLSRIQ